MYNPMELKNLIKEYTINLSGLNPDTNLGIVYETDISKMSKIFTTINNRFTFRNYVRTNLIKEDGNDIKISGTGNTLLSHMKLIDFYPVEYNMKGDNVLKPNDQVINPDNLVLFLACYPQKYDGTYGTKCSKVSAGLNIRIYRLEQEDTSEEEGKEEEGKEEEDNQDQRLMNFIKDNSNKNKNALTFFQGYLEAINGNNNDNNTVIKNVFNELKVYDKFKFILENKISPNFVLLYGYFISPNYKFKNLRSLHNIKESSRFDKKDKYETGVLIALTEGATSCLDYWRKEVHESRGRVRVSKSKGVYDKNIWLSIIFQIYATLIVINKYFNIKDITKDNFYIKILDNDKYKKIKYWKYIIDDISYYIPNYGYLVLFNSRFYNEEIEISNNMEEYNKDIIKKFLENISGTNSIINDEFTKNIVKNDTEKIESDESINNISEILIKSKIMSNFLNNRIGTELWQEEIGRDNENIISSQIFRKGDIVIHKDNDGVFRFVLFLNDSETDNNKSEIIAKVKDDLNNINEELVVLVDKSRLYRYSKNQVRQEDKTNTTSDFSNFIDIFKINTGTSNNNERRMIQDEDDEDDGGIVINDTSSNNDILVQGDTSSNE